MENKTFAALQGVGKVLENWEKNGSKAKNDPDMRKLGEVFYALEKRYKRMNVDRKFESIEKRYKKIARVPLPNKACATKCSPTNSNCINKCQKPKSFFSRLFSK
jgi:hypothetical protein